MESQRDVVFTPFMLRVRAALGGADERKPPRLRSSSLRPTAQANDDWVSQRARAEQAGVEDRLIRAALDLLLERLDGDRERLDHGHLPAEGRAGHRPSPAWLALAAQPSLMCRRTGTCR
jgi:hypothetical protein